MKTIRISIAALLLTATTALPSAAQQISRNKAWREAAKREARQLRAERQSADSVEHLKAADALARGEFVLEADRLRLKHGEEGTVGSTTNFVALHDGMATIQVSPSYSGGGSNGVGGITVEGTVSGIERSIDKQGAHHLTMNVSGTGVSAQAAIDLSAGNAGASATIIPNFNSFTMTPTGRIAPFAESTVFKGWAL